MQAHIHTLIEQLICATDLSVFFRFHILSFFNILNTTVAVYD